MTGNVAVITVDGPAGSGKGTVSQRIAGQLGWHILDSGALYRLVGFAAGEKRVPLDDEKALSEIALALDVRFIAEPGGVSKVILEGLDVSAQIRSETAGEAASQVAPLLAVREALLDRQRRFATPPGLVADGRDMGTVVFPGAPLKIYLTASAEVRAKRRLNQLKEHGLNASLADLVRDIQNRDARDMNREHAPLIAADDAVTIDTDRLSIQEVVEQVLKLASRLPNIK